MSDAKLPGEPLHAEDPPLGNERTVIKLPYAIANMVFIQALPFWILTILGILGFLGGFLMLASGKTVNQALATWIGSGICVMLGGVGLVVLKQTLWRRALEGSSAAITLVYILYVLGILVGPFFLLAIAAFVFLPMALHTPIGSWLWAIFIFCGLFWLVALMNVFEGEIWSFARLDGRCPRCRQWRFGRIRQPQIVRCANCGAELEFDRDS
jgi:hypothetical protein